MKIFYSKKLGKYYIDRKKCVQFQYDPFRSLDKNGVLLKKIPYTEHWDFYPVDIALFALGNYEKYLDSQKKNYKNVFLTQTRWLKNNISLRKDYGVWEHHYSLPYYDFPSDPWTHGMAQGVGISALLRAFQISDDDHYYSIAKKAMGAFGKEIRDGGVRFVDSEGSIWFEEYAIDPPVHILNGFIYALFGIFDFHRVSSDGTAKKYWDEGISTLLKNIERYDLGYWSLYNLSQKYPATLSYHKVHIEQLDVLFDITKEEIFRKYKMKWEGCSNSFIKRKHANIHRLFNIVRRRGIFDSIEQYKNRKIWIKKNTKRET